MRKLFKFAILMLSAATAGCTSDVAPGGPAPLGKQMDTDASIQSIYQAKPLATFPAMLAAVRLQASDYRSRTAQTYGHGAFSVVTTRDVEADSDFDQISHSPGVRGMAPLNRMLLPAELQDETDLRRAAARVKADILILYTFDTQFYVKDFAGPVTLFTLGLSPNRRAYVTTTASAILVDTRTGYVYGGAESTAKSDQLANGWTTDDAVDDTRLRTEKESFGKLLEQLFHTWDGVTKQYGPPASQPTLAP